MLDNPYKAPQTTGVQSLDDSEQSGSSTKPPPAVRVAACLLTLIAIAGFILAFALTLLTFVGLHKSGVAVGGCLILAALCINGRYALVRRRQLGRQITTGIAMTSCILFSTATLYALWKLNFPLLINMAFAALPFLALTLAIFRPSVRAWTSPAVHDG